jgi:hypothetical protein
MNNGQFTSGYDPRRNLEGRPHGSKNYTTVVSNFIEATVKYTNPLTDEKIDCTPPEALIMHLYYLAIVKDNTAAAKLLFDKIEAISEQQEKIDYDSLSYEDAAAEIRRLRELESIRCLQEDIDELQEIIEMKKRGELRNP